MGQKKKKRDLKPTAKTGKPQQHQQKTFLKLVEEASIHKVKPYIQENFQQMGFQLQKEQNVGLSAMARRLVVTEQILCDKLGFTMDELSDRVFDMEDKDSGYFKVDEIKQGDLARITVSTKAEGQEEFKGESKLEITDVGNAPFSLGPEVEPQLIGMKTGETKEVAFGKDKKMLAKITVRRVSEKTKAPKLAEEPIANTDTPPADAGETPKTEITNDQDVG